MALRNVVSGRGGDGLEVRLDDLSVVFFPALVISVLLQRGTNFSPEHLAARHLLAHPPSSPPSRTGFPAPGCGTGGAREKTFRHLQRHTEDNVG